MEQPCDCVLRSDFGIFQGKPDFYEIALIGGSIDPLVANLTIVTRVFFVIDSKFHGGDFCAGGNNERGFCIEAIVLSLGPDQGMKNPALAIGIRHI